MGARRHAGARHRQEARPRPRHPRPSPTARPGRSRCRPGEVDVILSDFVWVSLQRHQGNMVTMVPHSLTVGGLMVDPAAGIATHRRPQGQDPRRLRQPGRQELRHPRRPITTSSTGGKLTDDAERQVRRPAAGQRAARQRRGPGGAQPLELERPRQGSPARPSCSRSPHMLAGPGRHRNPAAARLGLLRRHRRRPRQAALKAFLDASFETKAGAARPTTPSGSTIRA